MPDAARLVAALGLALIAFIVSGQIMPLMPEGMDFGYFTWVNVGIGILTGWVVMGKRAGRGTTAAINNGLGHAAVNNVDPRRHYSPDHCLHDGVHRWRRCRVGREG